MILLIDNYDSFTYNLYQYLSELGAEVEVARNDKISLEEITAMAPEGIIISPGLSSTPAKRLPIMTELAPAEIALGMSPEWRIPPSAIMGIPKGSAALFTSRIALICGTPTPATTRVVQIDPGPIPTFNPSAPASIRSCAACCVAILPAIIACSGNLFRSSFTVSITFLECP